MRMCMAMFSIVFLCAAANTLAAPPNPPTIYEPTSDGVIVNAADVHMVSGFSDPDAGDTHQASDYEIWNDALTERVGMTGQVSFHQGSALDTKFEDGEFDGAFTMHVAMNIDDKPALYREVHRVLKPRAVFGIYDILAGPNAAGMRYPVPWATTPDASFLAPIDAMRTMLDQAGFEIVSSEDRTGYARAFFEKMKQQAAQGGPPQLGLSLIMGADFKQKVANMIENVGDLRCGPWEIVCRKR